MFNIHKVKVKTSQCRYVYNEKYKKSYYANDSLYNQFGYHERKIIRHTSNFTIKIKRNLFGIYTLPLFYNHRYYEFIIDTGASISGIIRKNLKDEHLKSCGELPIQSAGGNIKNVQVFNLDSIFIGSLCVFFHWFVTYNR